MPVSLDELPLPDELPVIPDGWRYESLGDLVEERGVSYGIVQPGSETPDGVPIVRVNNIRNGRIDTTDMLKVEAGIEAKFQRSRLRGGEVLLTLVGTLGEVAIVPDNLRGWNVARAVGVIPVRKDPGSLWVSICLRSAFIQHCIRTWATTTVQATFNLRDLAKLPIPIPPTDTREAIAAVLGALDDKIELNRRMNATLEAMARALFQSWFIDFDPVRWNLDHNQPSPQPSPTGRGRSAAEGEGAPGLDFDLVRAKLDPTSRDHPAGLSAEALAKVGLDPATAALFPEHLEDSPLGHIPEGWEVARLDEIATVMMGLSPDGDSYNADGVGTPLINGPVEFGEYFPVKTKWTEAATRFAAADDLIFCVRGSTTGRRVISDGEYGIGRGVCAIRAKGGFHSFLYQTINVGLDRLLEKTTGSVFPSLSAPDIKGFTVLKPSKAVLEAYERTTKPLVERIQQNQHQSRTLAALRDTLLPKLLSGELSLAAAAALAKEGRV